jgi:hypothetical protein
LMPSLSAAEREAETMKRLTASIRKHSPLPASGSGTRYLT